MRRRDTLALGGAAAVWLGLNGASSLISIARAATKYTIASIPKVRAP
jgi:hypothetical protein